jgi:D-alanyl-D-alanine carboxypeptidase
MTTKQIFRLFLSGIESTATALLIGLFLNACSSVPPKQLKTAPRIQSLTPITAPPSQSDLLPSPQLGYLLIDSQTQEVLESHLENQLFIPGSTTKIPTTFAALQILGPAYRFKTILATRGQILGTTLQGDLILKGTGDPVLKVAHLMETCRR